MYCTFYVVLYIVCVYMCTELLPPDGYPIAVNKYIISYHIIYQNHVKPSREVSLRIFKPSFATSQVGRSVSSTNKSLLIQYNIKICIYCDSCTEGLNTLWGQDVELLNVVAGVNCN
jgi:thioredoxin-related protein